MPSPVERHDLKEFGEQLDAGQAGLIVADTGADVEAVMTKAEEIDRK